MNKTTTIIAAILSALLIFSAYVAIPTYSQVVGVSTITETTTHMIIPGHPEYNWEIVTRQKDVVVFEEHLIQFNITMYENHTGMRSLLGNLSTDLYPLNKILQPVPAPEMQAQTIPTEIWDGITFLVAPGGPGAGEFVKYNHDDNKFTIRPNETNVDYDFWGTARLHQHTAQWQIEKGKDIGTVELVIAAIIGAIVFFLLIPEFTITKVICLVLGAVAVVLAALGRTVQWFLGDIWQTEMLDGWSWSWDFGRWLCFYWWRQSFGAWRDWSWFFVWADTGGDPEQDTGRPSYGWTKSMVGNYAKKL